MILRPGLAWRNVWLADSFEDSRVRMLPRFGPARKSTGCVSTVSGSRGSCSVIDDHELPVCRLAVDDFGRNHSVSEPVQRVGWRGLP
jgi:hypothetical protein